MGSFDFEHLLSARSSRRRVLLGAGTLAGWAIASQLSRPVMAQPKFSDYLFTLGVASGDPLPDGVVLWTRLVPDPLNDGGMPYRSVPVQWQIAADESMRQVIRVGTALATPELAHSVHVDVRGLRPERWYWYQFRVGDQLSPVGRTRTLPANNAAVKLLRFAFASCQQWNDGYYTAFRYIAEEDLDLVIHLGDYIYDVTFGGTVRSHGYNGPIVTLDQWRTRHALYKTDADLQAAHAAFPWVAVLDNHDTEPDSDTSVTSLDRRTAAYQAWYEHMPVRFPPQGAAMQIYRGFNFGQLARFNLLDTRQFRDDQDACAALADPSYAFGVYQPRCPEFLKESRTMLGSVQERWLTKRLEDSQTRWNVIGSTVLFTGFDFFRNEEKYCYPASWDGYAANRTRLLNTIVESRPSNPIIISGDLHAFWVNDVKTDPSNLESPTVATEFLGTSISSTWPAPLDNPIKENLPANPQVKFYNSELRGYTKCTVTPGKWETALRVVETAIAPGAPLRTLATYVVEDGQPGAQLA